MWLVTSLLIVFKPWPLLVSVFCMAPSHTGIETSPITCFLQYYVLLFQVESESGSQSVVSNSLWPHGLNSPWNSPGQNTRVGSLSLLQGIFPTQGWNPGLPHYRQILYQLSHKGSPRILEWGACSFSRGCSWPRNQTRVPALQVDSLPTELSGKPILFQVEKNLTITVISLSLSLSHTHTYPTSL